MTLLRGIGIEALPPFPTQAYNEVQELIELKFAKQENYVWFVAGWNGLGHRYRGVCRLSEELKRSFRQSLSTRSHVARSDEDQNLFYLASSALSAMECVFFSLAILKRMVQGMERPTELELKRLTPPAIADDFSASFITQSYGRELLNLIDRKVTPANTYARVYSLRNNLSHRGHPARKIELMGNFDGDTTLLIEDGIVLSSEFIDQFVSSLAEWMTDAIRIVRDFLAQFAIQVD